MSHVWFSPVSGAINQMDALRNPNPHRTDGSVIDEPPAARSLAVATASGAPIQRLSEHLLFAIFDEIAHERLDSKAAMDKSTEPGNHPELERKIKKMELKGDENFKQVTLAFSYIKRAIDIAAKPENLRLLLVLITPCPASSTVSL